MKKCIDDNNKYQCSGCGACANICPKNAIEMITDIEGYKYAKVKRDICIDCGLCQKVCPQTFTFSEGSCNAAYAVKASDDKLRFQSTSGAIFPIIAKKIIEVGGLVAGTVYDENFHIQHILSDKFEDIQRMKNSKYAQSETEHIFSQIFESIKEKIVLFTGTPCQCEGLRRYVVLKKGNLGNLILCDIVCGKVPSPKVWEDYVGYLEKQYSGKLKIFVCRDKKRGGWNYPYSKVVIGEKDVSVDVEKKCAWMKIYEESALARPSCYQCPFTCVERKTDITIGDFWGIEQAAPSFADDLGVSLVLLHSEKGKKLIQSTVGDVEILECDIDKARQVRLCYPTKEPESRQKFWDVYNRSIAALVETYGKRSWFYRFVRHRMILFIKKSGFYDCIYSFYQKIFRR